MRLSLVLFTSISVLVVLYLSNASGQTPPKTQGYAGNMRITSRFSAEDFAPDGDLMKSVWQGAEAVSFDRAAFGGKQYPESETRVASFWTPRYVYFAFWCKYSTLNYYKGEATEKERWELWNRDVAEVFINPEPARFNHYYEFEVSPNNQWIDLEIDLGKNPFNDAHWDSRFEHATRIDEAGRIWTCEMRIRSSSMGTRMIEPGMEWRLNFYRADGPGPDSQRRFLSWSPVPGPKTTFHQPASFGIIRFVNP